MAIGDKMVSAVSEVVRGLMTSSIGDIDLAYETAGELALSVAIKFAPKDDNGIGTTVTLSFTKEKVKVDAKFNVDEQQLSLFPEGEFVVPRKSGAR